MDAFTSPPTAVNEAPLHYGAGSPERAGITAELARIQAAPIELTAAINGERVSGGGAEIAVVQPHCHDRVLGAFRNSTRADAEMAVRAAAGAAPGWQATSFDDRASVFLKAAELLAGPWRARMVAATMLGQSKTVWQAEIDAACELIDFWRFNVHYASELLREQPATNGPGVWNRTDHRPLEGFVYAVTPFNFTAIAGNLATAPALMGNTVIWKPSPTQQLAAHLTMDVLGEAGLPPGVINMLPGDGLEVSDVLLGHPDLAGIHFTGSTQTFKHLWTGVADNLSGYRTYPRLIGETGGKGFILAHPSADPDSLLVALIRGAFEYQGQKCSAASRAYVPKSMWNTISERLVAETERLPMGDVTDLSNFMGAVIDSRAYARHTRAIQRAKQTTGLEVIAGSQVDDSFGYFVRPTIVLADDPSDEIFSEEYFGPILAIYVFDDDAFEAVAKQLEAVSPYALTGSVIARDRKAIAWTADHLRFAAGNFYINDKPTGAVVGQQPFGGSRASGTNDKAGAVTNVMRWTSTRSIKESFESPQTHTYPHMT